MDALERFFVGMAIVGFVGLFLTVGMSMYYPQATKPAPASVNFR
jgi:hypothetical protein